MWLIWAPLFSIRPASAWRTSTPSSSWPAGATTRSWTARPSVAWSETGLIQADGRGRPGPQLASLRCQATGRAADRHGRTRRPASGAVIVLRLLHEIFQGGYERRQ